MKGNNTLKLNHETMCEALQVWIDKTFTEAKTLTVTSVKSSTSSQYGGDTFEIIVAVKEPVAGAA